MGWIMSLKLGLFLGFLGYASVFSQEIILEAELGALTGVQVATSIGGYLGSGYVTGFDNDGDKVTMTANAPIAGTYQLQIRYNAGSYKEQFLIVNGASVGKVLLDATSGFELTQAGGVFLNAGTNTIAIEKEWGWFDLDQIILTPVPAHVYNITAPLVDAQATSQTQDLYNYLKAQYGNKVLSGQTSYWDQLIALAGATPKIRAFDFQNYSNHNPWGQGSTIFQGWDDGTTQNIINWYNSTNKCGIVTVQWHWLSPLGGQLGDQTFYTAQTDFDVRQAIIVGTPEYNATMRDIDTIASQIRRLDDLNIPILWRPLHEAGGGWFWWGAHGSGPALALYDILYNRLVNHHGLHNMIWVWSTPEADWYPGNSKVDIFGYDSYPGAYNYGTAKAIFDNMWDISGGEKILAMTENGPIPDIDQLFTQDARWAYFVSWDNLVASQNTSQHIQDVFSHTNVVNLGDDCLEAPVSNQQKFIYEELDDHQTLSYLNPAFEVSLYNLQGTLISQKRNLLTEQDLKILPQGVYIAVIRNKQGVSRKLISTLAAEK
jgi:mannan endo-1,4-beta-mannosidase